MQCGDSSFDYFILYEMAADFYVFGSLVEHWICSYRQGCLVVTFDDIVGGKFCSPISLSRDENDVTSKHINAMARYSASAVERATTDCFLVFHEMGELPSRTQYPEVDFLVVGQLAQSLSQ